jgi:hypothetical protein
MRHHFFFLLYLLLPFGSLFAQTGNLLIQNYAKEQYKGGARVWAAHQDHNKIFYFGQQGLLEYDGAVWTKSIDTLFIRSIDSDEKGNLYVSSGDNFGVISKRNNPKKFTSFLPLLPDSVKKITFITRVICHGQYVYFSGEDELLTYNRSTNQIISYWKNEQGFGNVVVHNNKTYLGDDGKGLFVLEGKQTTFIPHTDSLKEAGVWDIFTKNEQEWLIVTYNKGLFTYHLPSQTLKPFKTAADEWLRQNRLYAVSSFANTQGKPYFVLGSQKDGLCIIDDKGNIVQHLNKANGLIDNHIADLLTDHNNNTWAATDKGISQVFTSLPFRKFDHHQNIQSTIYDILKHNGKLYIGTATGVMVAEGKQFQHIPQMPSTQSWDLMPFGKDVIVAGGNHGFYHLVEGKIKQNIEADWATMAIERSAKDSNVVFNAKYQAFEVLRFEQGQFKSLGHIAALEQTNNRSVAETPDGIVWVGVPQEGFYKIQFEGAINAQSVKNAKVSKHTKGLGLLAGCYVVKDAQQKVLFSTRSGLYHFNEQTQSFELYTPYQVDYSQRRYKSFYPSYDSKGNVWLPKNLTVLRKKENQQYAIDSTTLQPLLEPALCFFEETDSLYWLAIDDKLYQYDARYKIPTQSSFPAVVRMVKISSVDSVLCKSNCDTNVAAITNLPYQYNSLLFEYATQSYYAEKENQFQYKLEGYDNSWSVWTKEIRKEYTNLPEGNYCFVVRAKNALQEISTESSYAFTIQPPFYRTWLAYCLYAVVAVLFVYGLIKINTHRLLAAKLRLENIVRQRTQEIQLKNAELGQQKEEILAQTENLKMINEEMKTMNEELNSTLELANFQKSEIEKQHEDIKASINYAQRIQTAMLPFEERIGKSLKDFFVFYEPRDIVSGDFYWFQDTSIASYSVQNTQIATTQNNKIIIAAADCTGHGVPGAFMSMIGNELLNQIVNMYHITSPDKILEALHKGILYALKQDQSNNKDGMDIAIVVLTKQAEGENNQFQSLEYAGAMNPLYLIADKNSATLPDYLRQNPTLTHEQMAFFDIKATKHPIGGHSEDNETRTFAKLTIDLSQKAANETLIFYLCSDGYQDQFGGEKGGKFMVRRLKNLLFEIHHQPLVQQKQILQQTFNNWKGQSKQIDDVLVMGIRL